MIDPIYVRVTQVRTSAQGQHLTNATGFFYLHDNYLYLVTARHVVLNEPTNHRPDTLHVSLHTDEENLQYRSDLTIPLYINGVRQWFQHPKHHTVDVAVVAINDPHALDRHFVEVFRKDDLLGKQEGLPPGQEVLILGFPLGFHDTVHNLPIVRKAVIASSYAHPFKGEPYFLTAARLHRGMSGSPVVVQWPPRGTSDANQKPRWRLLGIHSSALDVSDRDPRLDERLGLNMTWYASLIAEMLPTRAAATPPARPAPAATPAPPAAPAPAASSAGSTCATQPAAPRTAPVTTSPSKATPRVTTPTGAADESARAKDAASSDGDSAEDSDADALADGVETGKLTR